MGELQKLYVTLALDASKYAEGLTQAEGRARAFGDRVKGGLSTIASVGRTAFLGVGVAAVAGFGMVMGGAINMNASLETATLQFTTLMGDADMAAAHVQALFDFAAATPFESGQIIDASLKLQTFGGEALNTMDNLTLVGDAAAAVNAPIDEVAFWVGRLYSNLQAGQPFGEAAMRLQELGIMAPTARTELENMQAAGMSANDIFATFQGQLGTFTGAMELQSGTWQGLMSTIKDNLQMAMADGLRPFFDLAKQGLEALAKWLSSPEVQNGIKQLAAGLTTLIEKVTTFVTENVIPFVQSHGPELKAIVIALAVAFGALLVIGAVSAALSLLLNPVTWIVAAIGALAAAWAADWGGIRTKTEEVINFIKPYITLAIEFIRNFIGIQLAQIKAFWEQHGEGIVAAARKAWDLIKGVIDGVVRHIELIVEAFRLAFAGDWEGFGEKIFEIWENAWKTVTDFLGGLWDMVLPWMISLWENLRGWFQSVDWAELGRNIIQGIIDGVRAMGDALSGTLQGIVNAAIDRVKALLGIASPSTVFHEIGVNMGQGLIDGIRSMIADAAEATEALFDAIGNVSGLGGGFAGFFKARAIDPVKGRLDGIVDSLAEMGEFLGLGADAMNHPQTTLALMRMMGDVTLTAQQRDTAKVMLAFMDERGRLTAEYTEQQERLLRLQEQQADFDFLKQQLDLLKMVRDNGLDASILAGLEFGLDADAGGLMDAMTAAMRAMIGAAEDALGIHSPSRWAVGMMRNVFGAMAMTAGREAQGLKDSLSKALEPALALGGMDGGGGGGTDNSRRTTIYGGYHAYGERGGQSALEKLWEMAR